MVVAIKLSLLLTVRLARVFVFNVLTCRMRMTSDIYAMHEKLAWTG